MSDVIIACDFSSKEEIFNFLVVRYELSHTKNRCG